MPFVAFRVVVGYRPLGWVESQSGRITLVNHHLNQVGTFGEQPEQSP